MTALRRIRWIQFSIRTVLFLMFGVACYAGGWAAREWQHDRERAEAARAAEAEIDDWDFDQRYPPDNGMPCEIWDPFADPPVQRFGYPDEPPATEAKAGESVPLPPDEPSGAANDR